MKSNFDLEEQFKTEYFKISLEQFFVEQKLFPLLDAMKFTCSNKDYQEMAEEAHWLFTQFHRNEDKLKWLLIKIEEMKKENIKRAVQIDRELESIESKLKEIIHLRKNLQEPNSIVKLVTYHIPGVAQIDNIFTQSDMLLMCESRGTELVKNKEKLEKELETL